MSTLIPAPRLGGWTRSMLIELADRRTERRGSKTLDLNSEFLMALQMLCMERRWFWRRRTAFFQMLPNQWQYDLSLVPPVPLTVSSATATFTDGLSPNSIFATYTVLSTVGVFVGQNVQVTGCNSIAGAPADFFNGTFPVTAVGPGNVVQCIVGTTPGTNTGMFTYNAVQGSMLSTVAFQSPDAGDLQQFVKHGVRYYPNPGNWSQWGEITPLFERDLQTSAMWSNLYRPTPAPPQQYFLRPGAFLVLCLTPVPDQGYPISIDFWSVPKIVDAIDEQIPLVPAFLHHVLLKCLEAQIFRYTLGEGAAKYQAAMGEYTALVAKYSGMDGMVPGEHIDWSADDDYESTFENAQNSVQSTR
jgi:hypothetical protein